MAQRRTDGDGEPQFTATSTPNGGAPSHVTSRQVASVRHPLEHGMQVGVDTRVRIEYNTSVPRGRVCPMPSETSSSQRPLAATP